MEGSRTFQSSTKSSSSSSTSSRTGLVQSFQAALKRRRPLGMAQPSREIIPQHGTSNNSSLRPHTIIDARKINEESTRGNKLKRFVTQSKNTVSLSAESEEDASTTQSSQWGSQSTIDTHDENFQSYDVQRNPHGTCTWEVTADMVLQTSLELGVALREEAKKVQFSSENVDSSQGAHERMATGIDDILSHMDSLALTEMEWDSGNQLDGSPAVNRNQQHHMNQNMVIDKGVKSEGGISSLLAAKTVSALPDKLHQLEKFLQNNFDNALPQSSTDGSSGVTSTIINSTAAPMITSTTYCSQPPSRSAFMEKEPDKDARKTIVAQDRAVHSENMLQNDLNNTTTQSSVAGSSCVTSTLVNSTSAPMINSTTYCLQPQTKDALFQKEPVGEADAQGNVLQPLGSLSECADGLSLNRSAVTSQAIKTTSLTEDVNNASVPSKELQSLMPRDSDISQDSSQENNVLDNVNATVDKVHSRTSETSLVDRNVGNSKSEKVGRGDNGKGATSRKRGYNPDLFFKVNGKLYQRLGKIGSGGSSEVHKVISSDCKIYALKKIKLKGRDYSTAYGFCQEIGYLKRLKGKSNIIQLIDYEVTDQTLLQEVMNGSMSNKDGKLKDDGYIYMVLEYGEIDLAHMLSQKWKELEGSNGTIDENWLRFYWEQILLAVNTIHEERIVHSDLKPANFLLVRGSLKLIDFGIAKAIMSDTTNIQRDSQVGTLSYMSPEAFMCNETDANGNTIKCGRPSDIWSLGCILYQMVYGRTPFSEYKTFFTKFKVITDPNHDILYEPLSNPWLLDLMKKCLAWDRNKRWRRIPQLLQHPFLVPPVRPISHVLDRNLFQLIAETNENNEKALMLCSQIQSMIMDPLRLTIDQIDVDLSGEQLRKLLCKISSLCFQLQEQLPNS